MNSPKTLNALSYDMTLLLAKRMEVWARDPDLAAVVLRGAGERAFCAGGDLHSMYRSMTENAGKVFGADSFPGQFFTHEYALDYRIHTFPKPVMVWGNGIVMGGGMGLMMGASHRVVTDTSRAAMPEITIGLFPDVGGSWLLNRMPGKAGLFLGLTGLIGLNLVGSVERWSIAQGSGSENGVRKRFRIYRGLVILVAIALSGALAFWLFRPLI